MVNRKHEGRRANHFADTRCGDCGAIIPMGSVYNLYEQTTIRQEQGYAVKTTELVRSCVKHEQDADTDWNLTYRAFAD